MQFVDAHCHLHFSRIANVVSSLIQSAKEQGVRHFAVNATSPEDFALVDAIAAANPEVIPFYGIHPYYLSEETWETAFGELEKRKDVLKYIGEIGMDKSIVSRVPLSLQERCFKQQVHLASSLAIPFSVHCVRCVPAVYSVLKEEGPFPSSFLMHGYAGPPDYVQKLADLGAYFSVSGYLFNLSPKRRKAMEDTIRKFPLNRILLESDAPDMCIKDSLSLFDEAGVAVNTPLTVLRVCSEVASIRSMSVEKLAEVIFDNSKRFYQL